jgi:hypothetical protein
LSTERRCGSRGDQEADVVSATCKEHVTYQLSHCGDENWTTVHDRKSSGSKCCSMLFEDVTRLIDTHEKQRSDIAFEREALISRTAFGRTVQHLGRRLKGESVDDLGRLIMDFFQVCEWLRVD